MFSPMFVSSQGEWGAGEVPWSRSYCLLTGGTLVQIILSEGGEGYPGSSGSNPPPPPQAGSGLA